MTAKTDILAATSSTTASAKAAAKAAGHNLDTVMQHLQLKCDELRVLVNQAIKLTPGGDANLTALNNILAELA